ncbi:MAG: aminotransferase class V-fold PLP-dependent enzyme [Desulfobacteraceae bacterium]|nr:aminotransferase class V-fold PLP-dependent enzyme [Desulfobacteraceae bacterium]
MVLEDFDRYRSEFPITENHTFMNHAAVSSPPLRVIESVESLLREFSYCGIECYPKWLKRIAEVRELFAKLIKAHDHEIAFVGNTSEGLSTVAAGLGWKEGDVVLVPTPEFPANIYPWMNLERQGVSLQFIQRKEGRFGVREIERALKPRTRLLSVSSVDFSTGFRCDLEAIGDFCKRKGMLFCVDAIQSLGVIPMDVKKYGIHFMAAGSHKWLLSTMGCGTLFISNEVNDIVHPDQVGWKSVVDEEEFFRPRFDLKPDALRFESGTMNVAGIYALGAALDLLQELGIEKIYRNVVNINDLLFQGLMDRNVRIMTPMGQEERSGILSFIPSSDPNALFRFLNHKNITVALRNNMIRLSPHFYNNGDDVRIFFEALDGFGENA